MNDSRRDLRRRLLSARVSIEEHAQRAASEAIALRIDELIRGEAFARAGAPVVAGYNSARGEVDPLPALRRLRAIGWNVVLPVCGDDGHMDFCPWVPGEELLRNRYGIGEPTSEPVLVTTIDLVLVPGVGFSPGLSRVGHGVGYYDRWFARCFDADHDPLRWGLAHDLQIVALPEDRTWDVAMHRVITPTQVL